MPMPHRVRRFALTAHVACSVGLVGAVASFFALAVAGLASQELQTVRSAYVAGGVLAWHVILPLSLAALVTGLVQALGTAWGLFRHYWVLVKLLLTVFTVIVLMLQLDGIAYLARMAAATSFTAGDLLALRGSLVSHATGGLVVLLTITTLAIYKPRGLTRYGWRKQHDQRSAS
jgi:hypothetical protein